MMSLRHTWASSGPSLPLRWTLKRRSLRRERVAMRFALDLHSYETTRRALGRGSLLTRSATFDLFIGSVDRD